MAAEDGQFYDGDVLAALPDGGAGVKVGDIRTFSRYLRVGFAAALAVSIVIRSPQAREFRAADIQEESYPTVQALLYMDKLVAERTQGRHRIRVFHSRQLGEESQTIEQTRVGAIDLNRINAAAIGDVAPPVSVLALPFLFNSIDHLYKVIDGPIGDDILAAIEPNGFIGLAYYDSGARSIYTRAPAVHGLPDLRGLRIRVQQSDLVIRMMKALGAEPVALPYGQVLTALQARLVDGAENNWPSYVTTGHYKLAQFYTLTEHTMGPEVLVMSRRAWQELSDADRAIFRAAARESSQYMRAQWLSWEEQSRKEAAEGGATIIGNLDRKPFEDATRALRDEMRADPRLGRLIERIEAAR
jgi:tripartite ATP-independent transporter DctP family solute receptor